MIFLLTVFAVSLDAYIAGLAYNLKRKLNFAEVLYAGAFTFFVSALALILNEEIASRVKNIKEIGALVFMFLGLKNYLSYFSGSKSEQENSSLVLLGIGVSIDAGIACLTMELTMPILVSSLVMFLGHFIFLLLGAYTARLVKFVKNFSLASGIALMALGVIKLFS